MIIKIYMILVTLTFSIGGSITIASAMQNTDKQSREEEWSQCKDFDFPVLLASNLPPKPNAMQLRKIFLFLDPRFFTEGNLIKVVTIFAQKYPEPKFLNIVIFGDKNMLRRAIYSADMGFSINFADTAEGKKAEQEFYKKHFPLKTGYWRAYYWRSPMGEETLNFSPDPMKEEVLTIMMGGHSINK